MKCKLCGQQFTKETAQRACEHCFLHANCHLIKCPNCGYEFPEESAWLSKIFKSREPEEPVRASETARASETLSAVQGGGKAVSGELPLSQLERGCSAFISRIQTKDRTTLKKLMALGFLPGCEVRLQQCFPAYVVELGNSQYAIDKYVAEQILVQNQG